jgi:hypothetical protein
MESPIQVLEDWINERLPLPRPEAEEDKFLGGLEHLSLKQIRGVLKIVIDEVKNSRKFKLFIDDKLRVKEEEFFLVMLNRFGGIGPMVNNHSFEEASKIIGDTADKFFDKEAQEFFEKFKNAGGGSRLRYNNHLEITRGHILNEAYNHHLDL